MRTSLREVGCGGSRYGVICTFREKSHDRQPCATYQGGGLVGQSRATYNSRVLPAASNSGMNGRGVIVGCLQQYQITMGFRPGNKSSGMAERTS